MGIYFFSQKYPELCGSVLQERVSSHNMPLPSCRGGAHDGLDAFRLFFKLQLLIVFYLKKHNYTARCYGSIRFIFLPEDRSGFTFWLTAGLCRSLVSSGSHFVTQIYHKTCNCTQFFDESCGNFWVGLTQLAENGFPILIIPKTSFKSLILC